MENSFSSSSSTPLAPGMKWLTVFRITTVDNKTLYVVPAGSCKQNSACKKTGCTFLHDHQFKECLDILGDNLAITYGCKLCKHCIDNPPCSRSSSDLTFQHFTAKSEAFRIQVLDFAPKAKPGVEAAQAAKPQESTPQPSVLPASSPEKLKNGSNNHGGKPKKFTGKPSPSFAELKGDLKQCKLQKVEVDAKLSALSNEVLRIKEKSKKHKTALKSIYNLDRQNEKKFMELTIELFKIANSDETRKHIEGLVAQYGYVSVIPQPQI
jgi:hypothetical protein